MPIFIDELVIRGEVTPPTRSGSSDRNAPENFTSAAERQAIVSEVTEAVIEHLERALERVGER